MALKFTIRFSIQIYTCFFFHQDFVTFWFIIYRRYAINTYVLEDCAMFALLLCFMCVSFVNICVNNLIETAMYISTLFYFTSTSTSQWIKDLKGSSVYSFFYILAFLDHIFLACLDTTYISCYIFFKKLKFEVFKTEKAALKNLIEGKYRRSENEEFESFERVNILILYTFLEKENTIDVSHCYLAIFGWKTF